MLNRKLLTILLYLLIGQTFIIAASPHITLANFSKGTDGFSFRNGSEFPGATGNLKITTVGSEKVAQLSADFRKGGVYVSMTKQPPLLLFPKSISLLLRSSNAKKIALRLVDSTNQVHQQIIKITPDNKWQQIQISNFTKGQSWGGAKDRKWHPPLKRISILLEKSGLPNKTGSILIKNIYATGEIKRNTLKIRPSQAGNLFYDNEPIIIPLATEADLIKWQVQDYWGRNIISGKTKANQVPANEKCNAKLNLPIKKRGYYFVSLEAIKDGKTLTNGYTSFGIIEPSDMTSHPTNPFGVCTHFAQRWNRDLFPLLKKIGISAIRDEQYWGVVEKEKGKFTYPKRYTEYMTQAKALGIDVLMPLTFANKNYDKGLTPYTDEGCNAYGRYAQALLKKYGMQIKWLEPWNEYNGTWCKGPATKDRSKYYTKLLKHAYKHIKDLRPDVEVIGCAPVLLPMMYMEGIFKHGGLNYLDKIVIHPYRGQPEGVDESVEELQKKIRHYNNGKDIPLWATETGFHNRDNFPWEHGHQGERGRRTVAKYNIRQNTLLLSKNVEKLFIYLARDYNNFKTMGLFRDQNSPLGRYAVNPNGIAYAVMIRKLCGAKFIKREPTNRFSYVEHFQKAGKDIRVCWATEPTHLTLKSKTPLTVTDMMGHTVILNPINDEIYLTLTDTPIYVEGNVTSITKQGRFNITGKQVVDILDKMKIKLTYNPPSNSGLFNSLSLGLLGKARPIAELRIKNTKFTLKPGSNTITIPNETTSNPRKTIVWYELFVDNILCGLGGIEVDVIDPLMFSQNIQLDSQKRLNIKLANHSQDASYEIKDINWQLGVKSDTINQKIMIPQHSETTLSIPVANITPYAKENASIEINFAKRSSIKQSNTISYCPIWPNSSTSTPKVNLIKTGLNRQHSTLKASGKFTWDNQYLYINIYLQTDKTDQTDSRDLIRLAVAPSFSGRWYKQSSLNNWKEFTISPTSKLTVTGNNTDGKPETNATLDITQNPNTKNYKLAIPWAELVKTGKPLPEFRLSILIKDKTKKKTKYIQWGGGILFGKTPEKFKTCILQDNDTSTQKADFEYHTTNLPETNHRFQKVSNSSDDYSKNQGKNNWYFGYYDIAATNNKCKFPTGTYSDDAFKEMSHKQTIWGYKWKKTDSQFANINRSGMHPDVFKGLPGWVVRRWASPIEGTIKLKGHYSRNKKADGSGAAILVDGVEVFSKLLGGKTHPANAPFDLTIPVKRGTIIDFCVTPGEWTTLLYDGVKFNVDIYEAKK